MWSAISWANLEDLLVDLGAVLIVTLVIMVWAVRANRDAARRMAREMGADYPGPPDAVPPAPRPGSAPRGSDPPGTSF